MGRLFHLVKKELRQVMRDSNMLRVIFVVPMVQLLILGYAITTEIKNLDILICDLDGSELSRELNDRFSKSDYFHPISHPCQPGEVEAVLFKGKAVLALVIPKHFGRDLEASTRPEIQVLLDGQNSNTSAVALGYANRILLQFMQEALSGKMAGSAPFNRSVHFIQPATRIWYNPELKSVYYMIPGIISIILTIITMLLTSIALVKEREIGTLEQLMVAPISPGQIIAGKTIPFACLGMIEMGVAMSFGILWFGIPVAGSLFLLALLSTAFITTTLGLGILISTLVNTQQQALFSSWSVLVTFILLSGFFYPIENMPSWVKSITLVNPLRYFIEILRELFLKGADLTTLWPEFAALLTMGGIIFTLAVLRFHKRTA